MKRTDRLRLAFDWAKCLVLYLFEGQHSICRQSRADTRGTLGGFAAPPRLVRCGLLSPACDITRARLAASSFRPCHLSIWFHQHHQHTTCFVLSDRLTHKMTSGGDVLLIVGELVASPFCCAVCIVHNGHILTLCSYHLSCHRRSRPSVALIFPPAAVAFITGVSEAIAGEVRMEELCEKPTHIIDLILTITTVLMRSDGEHSLDGLGVSIRYKRHG